MPDIGSSISKDGINVLTAQDYELSLTSKYKHLTIAFSGTVSIVWNGSAYVVDGTGASGVPHNLGRVPIFRAWVNKSGQYFPAVPAGAGLALAWSDQNTLYFETDHSGTPYTFKYVIFNERLA